MNDDRSHNFWLFLELLAKRRGLIFTIVILATLAALGISLVLPKWYKATALLLPPKNISMPIAGLNSITEAVSVTTGLTLPGAATPSDIYVSMLKSRTIANRVIKKFDLVKKYKRRNLDEAYKKLMGYCDFRVTEEGLLVVAVEDKNPKMAADLVNAFVAELDSVNQEIVTRRINESKAFIGSRLIQVKKELDSTRRELESFQMKYKTVDFDEQTRLAVEQAIQLKIDLAKVDFDLKMKEISLGKGNTELVELKQKRNIIQKQLQQLENQNPDSSFFSLPIASIPALKGQYEFLYSRVKVAENLYQMLLEQQEKTKIKEYEKMPAISVLDRAQPPQLKSRPKRAVIVLGTFGLSIIFALFLAALLEYLARLKDNDPLDYSRAMLFIRAYFGWIPGVKKGKK
ncbi:MAG: hypothetical protein GXO93_08455 [FCB group bacterium]|nr:hypothetical protein [FCB group bacterium]